MMPLKKITVSILGEQYQVVSDEQEADVLEAARITEMTLEGLLAKAHGKELSERYISRIALLKVSLNVATHGKEMLAVQRRLLSLIDLADRALGNKASLV